MKEKETLHYISSYVGFIFNLVYQEIKHIFITEDNISLYSNLNKRVALLTVVFLFLHMTRVHER